MTLLVTRRKPVAIGVDTAPVDERIIQVRRQITHELLKAALRSAALLREPITFLEGPADHSFLTVTDAARAGMILLKQKNPRG